MHDEDSNPILNDIAKSITAKGGKVEVYRLGRGILGTFDSVSQAGGRYKINPEDPSGRMLKTHVSNFWELKHNRGSEILIKSAYEKLEVRKINPSLFHIIVPA